jgi:diguanylate cyclase (GGDEF)-like protein
MTDLFAFDIDIPTLAITRAMVQILLAGLLLYLGKSDQKALGAKLWAIGFFLNGASLIAFVVTPPESWNFVAYAINHFALGASCVFLLAGFWQFGNQARQYWVLIALIVIPSISLLCFYWLWPNTRLRILMSASSQLLFLFMLQQSLSKPPRIELSTIYKRLRIIAIAYWIIVFWSYASIAELLPTSAEEIIGYHRVFFSVSSLLFMLSLAVGCLTVQFALLAARNADLAEVDWLTDCLNRRGFFKRLILADQEQSQQQMPYTVISLDLDHFKTINDRYGHAAGDELLKKFGGILNSHTQAQHLVARMGGEEFCIVMLATTEPEGIHLAQTIQHTCAQTPIVTSKGAISFTVSFGVCQGDAGTPIESTILQSDSLLYRSKVRGRNRIESNQS